MPDNKPTISPVDFQPLQQPHLQRQKVSPRLLVLGAVVVLAVVALLFMTIARPVIFHLDPADARLDVSGLNFRIGGNYLLLPGSHKVKASALGYHDLHQQIEVNGEGNEFELLLLPLPGKLQIESSLTDIEVFIDQQAMGTAPGLITGIERGIHQLELRKKRYFPVQQNIDIEGLDHTQQLTAELVPAWGQMAFSSVPDGANLYVDGELIGQTPLQTEVLETGSQIKISAPGFKVWQKDLTIKAGSTEQHPTVTLEIADGFVSLNSNPSGAAITVNGAYRGTAPARVALPPNTNHRIELFLQGYLKTSETLSVKPEQERELTVALKANIGSISLQVSPADAQLTVDGKTVGTGSQTLSLPARKHQLEVKAKGYAPQSHTITPRPQQQQSLRINLLTLEQAYWATRPSTITSPVGNTLKLFRPDGTPFTLGAPRREPGRRANEGEQKVALMRPFYLATHETTNQQFRRWREQHSSSAMMGQTLDMPDQPAVKVSWEEAALFCNWLSQQQGLPAFYRITNGVVSGFNWQAHGYRLPTEAEWEWAARIDHKGKRMMFPWGNDLYPPLAVSENYADRNAAKLVPFTLTDYDDSYPVAAVVGSFEANHNGLFDMGGNVAEWVNDYYDLRVSNSSAETDPRGPATGSRHVVRGASWALASRAELRLSYREPLDDSRLDVGFRLARYVDSPETKP